jgi:hypothetical protein
MTILESYILSEKTLSVDFDDWVTNKKGPLLIPGYMGSGKSIIGQYLANTYNREVIRLDNLSPKNMYKIKDGNEYRIHILRFHKKMIDMIRDQSNKDKLIEGLPLLDLYNEQYYRVISDQESKDIRKLMLNCPMILLGTSILRSISNVADRTMNTRPKVLLAKTIFAAQVNLSYNKWFQELRKDRLNVGGADIKRFEIPKFKVEYGKN